MTPVNGVTIDGDTGVAEQIMRRYAAMVFRVSFGVTQNTHDAEDATQVVFLALLEQIRSGQPIANIGAWLHKVAYRVALDTRRNKKRRLFRERVHGGRVLLQQTDSAAAANGELEESKAIVAEELNKLPAKYRLPLILHYFGGLSQEEMARELHCRTGALRVRLFRAREKLAKLLSDRGLDMAGLAAQSALERIVHSVVTESIIAATRSAAVNGLRLSVAASAPPAAYSLSLKLAALLGLLAAPAIPTAIRPLIRAAEPALEEPQLQAFNQWPHSDSSVGGPTLAAENLPASASGGEAAGPSRSASTRLFARAPSVAQTPSISFPHARTSNVAPRYLAFASPSVALPLLKTGPTLMDWTPAVSTPAARPQFSRSIISETTGPISSQSAPQLAAGAGDPPPTAAAAPVPPTPPDSSPSLTASAPDPQPHVHFKAGRSNFEFLAVPAFESGSAPMVMISMNGAWEALYATDPGQFAFPARQEFQIVPGPSGAIDILSVSVPEPAGLALLAAGAFLLKRRPRRLIA
ncbi:MAG TPA: RNA polymerase sigma factor [Tepidisphaeraceae bacterium]|nr:RNA polymerase sigma factor [Tepidisphaeraceae bacterium]